MGTATERGEEESHDPQKGRQKDRSPNYPILDLGNAIEKAEMLHKEFRTHSVPIEIAHERWGYKPHSGLGNQIVAALKSYGLVKVVGQGQQRKISVSVEGDRIIRKAPDREELLKEVALHPPIHTELWQKFGGAAAGVPQNDLLRHYLVWERPEPRFNDKTVDGFIEKFRQTLGFAGLVSGGITAAESRNRDDVRTPKVGDCVQWRLDGLDQFSSAREVLGVSEDGQFAFVAGIERGLPIAELALQASSSATATNAPTRELVLPPPANPFYRAKDPEDNIAQQGMANERVTLDEGPVTLVWPDGLSQESVREFEYWIHGVIRRARRKAGLSPEPKERRQESSLE